VKEKLSKYKLAIVMRTDLEMGKGKMCVQAGHASTMVARKALFEGTNGSTINKSWEIWHQWFNEGQFKVVLKVQNELGLKILAGTVYDKGLSFVKVYDFGLTQVEPNTLTCIAIGPALSEDIDKVTGNLPLL